MPFHLDGDRLLIAFLLLAVWTIFWSLVFARALKYVLRQRLLERAMHDRLERMEREWARSAPGSAAPALSNE